MPGQLAWGSRYRPRWEAGSVAHGELCIWDLPVCAWFPMWLWLMASQESPHCSRVLMLRNTTPQ